MPTLAEETSFRCCASPIVISNRAGLLQEHEPSRKLQAFRKARGVDMNSRTTTTIILAVVLMVLVMGAAAAITFTGMASRDKWTLSEAWTQPAANLQSP